jgi:hypothetical protein
MIALGRGRGFGGGRRGFGRSPRGFGRRGNGSRFFRNILHGLFLGWLLSHLFGGGFPLILPLIGLALLLLFALRRRRPMSMR